MEFLYPKSTKNWMNFINFWNKAQSTIGFDAFSNNYDTPKARLSRLIAVSYVLHFCFSGIVFTYEKNFDVSVFSEGMMGFTVAIIILAAFFSCIRCKKLLIDLAETLEVFWAEASQDEDLFQIVLSRGKDGFRSMALLGFTITGAIIGLILVPLFQVEKKELPLVFPAYGLQNLKESYYVCNYIYHVIAFYLPMAGIVGFLNIYVHMNLQIAAQFDALGLRVMRMGEDDFKVKETLRFCYYRHMKLRKCINTISFVYRESLIIEVASGTLNMCVVMFNLFNYVDILKLAMTLMFFFGGFMHIFMYCVYAEILDTANTRFCDSLYNCSWENLDVGHKRSLVIIMMNAQVPVRVSIFGVVSVNLEMFMTLMKTAYSLYAVMSTVSGKTSTETLHTLK